MKAALPGLLVLAALLIVPFVLRPRLEIESSTARRLVVLTSHNEAIRYEMSRGFRHYLRRRGAPEVSLDWRSPGGTSEIARYLGSEYRSAFEQYFRKHTGRALSDRAPIAFRNPNQGPTTDHE